MANSTNIDPKVLQDYVATANSGKYGSWDEINAKFPEFKSVNPKILQDYVATANSGKYKSWDEINSKFPEFQKKKGQGVPKVEPPKAATITGSRVGLPQTQPTDGLKPAPSSTGSSILPEKSRADLSKFLQSRTDKLAESRAVTTKGNILTQAPTVGPGPQMLSETDPKYLERKKKIEEQQAKYDSEVQGVLSYLKTSPKDLLFDEDALNEDMDYLKRDRGYSDQAIMAGVDQYKKSLQKKKTDTYLSNQFETVANEMQLNTDMPEPEKKKYAEGRVFSKALQAGVESMTDNEKKAYVLLGDLKKVKQQLADDPENNSLIVKSADLTKQIGGLLDNDKMLFDPVTGELVDKPTPETEKYQADVNAEAAKLKATTTEDKLAKNYMDKYAAFKYWDDLYDDNQRNLASGYTLGVSPDEFRNKQIREAKTVKDNYIKAKKEFDVAKKSFLLNRDPSGVARDYGLKAAGEVFLETITPQVVQDMLPGGMMPLTDKTYLEIVQNQLPESGVELSPAMKERFKKTLTEEVVEGTGGLIGILPKLWLAGRIVEAGSILTGVDEAIIALRNGNAFDKSMSFLLRAGLEETKTQTAGFAPGVGAGFQIAGETIRIPRLKGKFGVILQPALDAAVAGSIGGTVGMELGEVIAKTVDTLGTNQDWADKMEELFPDFDTVERRIVTNLIINGLFGMAHMPKGSLTFSPEKLQEMARKMEAKGRREEARYLMNRAAELGGYQKVDLQIAQGATGVAGRRAAQEQRPVVAPQPPAPETKPVKEKVPATTAEPKPARPAPAPVTQEQIEAVAKKVNNGQELTVQEKDIQDSMGPQVDAAIKRMKAPAPTTVGESLQVGKAFEMNGEKGSLSLDGNIVVFETKDKITDLGNKDQIADRKLSEFGIVELPDIILNEDNSLSIGDKTYVNNFSDPEMAISKDSDGNYVVDLGTPDGKKRTFRGDRAENIAYQIKLKKLNDANERTIEEAHRLADEAIAAETKVGEVAPEAAAPVTREVEPTKPIEDAVQIETAGEVPVQPEARVGEQVAEGKPQAEPQAPAQEGRPEEVAPAQASDAAKGAEIERRREEKLDKANQRRQKTSQREDARVKVETYRTIDIDDNPVEAEITTNKDGSRVLKARLINEDGSVEPMAHFTERINNKAQLSLTNEKIVEAYIGNEGNTLQRTNLDENPDQTYINKINADFDAEYIDAVKNGKMTREQAMQALEEVGRKDSNAYAELAALGAKPTPIAKERVPNEELLDKLGVKMLSEAEKDELPANEQGKIISGKDTDISSFKVGDTVVDSFSGKVFQVEKIGKKTKDGVTYELKDIESNEVRKEVYRPGTARDIYQKVEMTKGGEAATKKPKPTPPGAEYSNGDKVIWDGQERSIISSVKIGKEFKYEIDLGEGKTIWTDARTIESEAKAAQEGLKKEKPVPAKAKVGATKETVDIEALKEEVDKNGRPLSEFKDGDVVIFADKSNDAWDIYVEGTVSRKDGEVKLIRFKENPASEKYKYAYLSENTKVIPKPEGDPIYIGPEDFSRKKPSPAKEEVAPAQEQAASDIEAERADIERRRQETLRRRPITSDDGYELTISFGGYLSDIPYGEERIIGKTYQEVTDKINAYYDRQLVALSRQLVDLGAKPAEAAPDAATFLKDKLGLNTKPGEKAVPETRTTEEKITEAQKTVDDAAKWLKEKLNIRTLPPDTKAMGMTGDGLIDLAADAVKQLVAAGIKTADAVKQVIDALREGGYLKGIDEKDFTSKLSGIEQPKPTGKIEWQPVEPRKGDKDISARKPVVTAAASQLLRGQITNQQYRDIVEQNSPIGPINKFIEPATEQQVKNALSSEKIKNAIKPVKPGEKVGLRVDIPAFERHNTWVVSVHEGHSKKSPVLSYTSVARISNVSFGAAPNETIRMAAGNYKDAVSKIFGEWNELPGKDLAEKAENAKALIESIANDPNWIQVGMNPFRHSYFYDRSRDLGRPLVSADEVIQIGGLVYAKNPVYGKWTDAAYKVKGILDAAGQEVRFSKTTGKPEYIKPVDQREKEIIDEMNNIELVNKGIEFSDSTTSNKINVEELNSSLDTPLNTVQWGNYEGIPFIFTISDQLRSGDTVNPFTGEVIRDLKGGIGFNGTKGHENMAWANTSKAEVDAIVNKALQVYNKNKPLFDKLWKDGKLPDGHIPMAVVKMAETSILSNEALFRVGIQNVSTLPVSNRKRATNVLKDVLKLNIKKENENIKRGTDPKTGETYSANTLKSKSKMVSQYENILNIIKNNNYKDIVDVLKDNKNFSLPEKAIIVNQVFYGEPTSIGGKSVDVNRSKPKTPVSKALIGTKDPSLINIGKISDILTEPSMKDVPSMHIVSIVGVDVKNPEALKTTHPNYPYASKGTSIGILEQPIHMKDAFGEAYGSVISQVTKNEVQNTSITPSQAIQQGIPVQSGLPNNVYKAAVAKNRLDAVDKLAGFVRQVFPRTTFFTTGDAWDAVMADPRIKKQMKDGDVVYGVTVDGQAYINPNLKSTKVLLHESGHIWGDFVKIENPKLWDKGLSLVDNTNELKKAQSEYGDTPKAREEALMEIMSTKGDTIVNAAQKADFKEWLLGLWKYIGQQFSSLLGMTPKEIENLTLDKFIDGMLADILSGKELKAGKKVADTKESMQEAMFSKESAATKEQKVTIEPIDFENESENIDVYDASNKAEKIAKENGVNILRGKELKNVALDNNGDVIGGLWTEINGNDFSFDIAIDKASQGKGVGEELVKEAISEFKAQDYKGDLKYKVDVTNPIMEKLLSKYGFVVKEKIAGHTIMEHPTNNPKLTTTTKEQPAPTKAEQSIDQAAAWLKEKLKVRDLPEGTQTMGMSQDDLIDLVALAAKKIVSKGAKVTEAIKQVLDSLRAGGFLANMNEKEIAQASRRRMSPSYETDMYKIHERLVDMAKDYIAKGGASRKEFAYQVGVKEKNVEQAWEEASGIRTYNKDQIDRRLADITRTAIMRGFNVRTRLDELLQTNRDIRSAINNFMRSKELYAVVNPLQAKALVKRAANVRTMEQLDKFIEYADKVINDANYAQDMSDIRKMQEAAKRVKHTGNTKAVKEFASINPENIPDNLMADYMKALDELSGKVPNYSTMQSIYFDVVGKSAKARDFSNIVTFNKAADMFNQIMSNQISSVEDYRKLFSDINGLKRRLKQLFENDTITMDEFDTIMDQIGKTTDEVKQKFSSQITKLKTDLLTDIRSKTLDYKAQNKEEQRIIDAFKEQNNDDLRRLEPEDLWELNELIDRANEGNFDYYRWNGVVAEAEKMRRGEILGEQLKDAKRMDTAKAERKLAKQESTFIEGVLGLGRSQAGAVSKYIVSEVERAAGSYNVAIKDGLNTLMKAKGKLDKESMHKMGMIVTYLQEYMAQFNPRHKNVSDIGTRDWFGEILNNPDMMSPYIAEKAEKGLMGYGEKTKADVIKKIYDSLPKNADGKVDPKAVYESIMNKDGRFLNAKEQAMLDAMMDYIDTNIKPKQEAANFSRGLDFEALSFYMPRIDLGKKMDIEAKIDMSRDRVRIKSGYGKERDNQQVRAIEVDFEVAITRAIEAANRDYYFGKALDMVNGTLGYATKAGGSSKNMAEIIATNIKDMMEFEFARKQSDAAQAVGALLLTARAAQTLLDPIRTVLVELPATFLQVPLRAGNVSGYVDILNPTNGKLFQDLLDFSESPLRLRENISRAIDIDEGAIKPQAMKDKAVAYLAGAPERITMIGAWMPSFKNEFLNITGEKFDVNKFQSDPNYRKKYSRAIKEAASSADMTTQKIIGVTTKLSQAREIEFPFTDKGLSKDESWGKTLGFFGNYPRREYIEFTNGFKEIGERYRDGEGVSSLTSISKPLSVAMGTLTYGYMSALVYALKQYYFGTDDEKEKANEALDRMSSVEGVAEEAVAQSIALAGSKYYSAGRFITSGLLLVAYNNEEDPKKKEQLARLYKNAFYADPIDPDASKTFSSKDNKKEMSNHLIRFIPQLALVVDKYQQGLEAYGGYEKLMDKYDSVGFEKMTKSEKDLWMLGDIILKAGGIVANLYGTAIPMEKTLQMFIRGQYESAKYSKGDIEDMMKQRYERKIKTPEERKESYEERMKRRRKEMDIRKYSKEYGVPYRKP